VLVELLLTSTDTLSIVALPQETVDTTDGESQTGLRRATKNQISDCVPIVSTREKIELDEQHLNPSDLRWKRQKTDDLG
jgi:hypothetical protein